MDGKVLPVNIVVVNGWGTKIYFVFWGTQFIPIVAFPSRRHVDIFFIWRSVDLERLITVFVLVIFGLDKICMLIGD